MKRKLSFGMSLISGAEVLFLDEPTCGMDILARRNIWNFINSRNLKKNITIIFTSHDMEEVSILCDRIGVVAAGEMKCIGTTSHITDKFGSGYNLSVICLIVHL
jgi:ABC-type multidrug transport system ATPase subunit